MPKNYTRPNGKTNMIPDPKRFLYNVDTLYYSATAENFSAVMDNGFRELMEEMKEKAGRFEDEQFTISINLPNYQNEIALAVQPNGKTSYSYQVRNEDFAFYFMRHENEGTFPIYVQINQFKLWKDGVREAYQESLYILAELGFYVSGAKPSRIDLCCHSDQWQWLATDLKKFEFPKGMYHPDYFRFDVNTMKFETVMFGNRSRNQMRLYNKSAELFAKKKYHFLDVYKREFGIDDVNDLDTVWNIEFEMHRKFLKEFVVDGQQGFFDSMDNLLSQDGLNLLWSEMTKKRFIHHSPFWRQLQKGDKKKFFSTNKYMDRVKDIDDSLDRETSQVFGRLQKFAVNKDIEENYEFDEAQNTFINHAELYIEKNDQKLVRNMVNEIMGNEDLKNLCEDAIRKKLQFAFMAFEDKMNEKAKKRKFDPYRKFTSSVNDKRSRYVDKEINSYIKKENQSSTVE